MEVYIVVTFLLLGIALFVTGTIMLFRLKKYFKEFYLQFGIYFWAANLLLAVPLILRSISDTIKYEHGWNELVGRKEIGKAAYNLIFFCLTTYLPIVS